MKRRIATLLAVLGAVCGCSAQKFVTLAPDDFQKSVGDASVQLVDVRTPEEYAEQHLPGSVNIDFYAEDFVDKCTKLLDKERPVAVYCRSGKRSAGAAAQLCKAGFTQVINLDGGITAWIEAAKPVSR